MRKTSQKKVPPAFRALTFDSRIINFKFETNQVDKRKMRHVHAELRHRKATIKIFFKIISGNIKLTFIGTKCGNCSQTCGFFVLPHFHTPLDDGL